MYDVFITKMASTISTTGMPTNIAMRLKLMFEEGCLMGVAGSAGLTGLMGLVGLVGFVGFVGLMGCVVSAGCSGSTIGSKIVASSSGSSG